jgi:transposase
MAQERLAMRNVATLLRLHFKEHQSGRKIAQSLGIGVTTVHEYLSRAKCAGVVDWPSVERLSETELEARLGFKKTATFGSVLRKNSTMPDLVYLHREMSRPSVTLALLWTEYRENNSDGYGYTQFCEHYRRFTKKLSVVMRQTHKAGERTFVDYSDGLWLVDSKTGERTQTDLFVGCLGASSYTFAEATLSQTSSEWISSHAKMWNYFGGVTEITVPDNLKSGVTKADRYEPLLNETYRECADHYGTCAIPARPVKPRDKAKVEAAVLVAQRWILARLRDRLFNSLCEMNEAIAECLEILNSRKMKHLGKSRRELFEELDRPALRALPAKPYEFAEWKKATVNIDYHITFDHHHYSAPYQLVHERLDVRATAAVVEIFNRGTRVASHRRSVKRGGYTTSKDHMPKSHREHAEWTPERVVNWSGKIGPMTARLVEEILKTKVHPQQGFAAALGIIRLEGKYGRERVECAAGRALRVQAHSYKFVSEMLKNKMDNAERDQSPPSVIDPETKEEQLWLLGSENIRGGQYYQ